MIVLDTIFPLFALLFTGSMLRRTGFTDAHFLKTADRLVYYIFFPTMLFWKIGGADPDAGIDMGLCAAGVIAVSLVFGLSLLVLKWQKFPPFQAGAFVQSCFRFNTYIGMALILQVLGEEGVRHFGVLVGIVIPMINVFSVSVLIWHSSQELNTGEKARFFVRALVSNPLIVGCVAGLFYSRAQLGFPSYLHNAFGLMTSITLPLALLSIGGALNFNGIRGYLRPLCFSTVLKLGILPLTGFVLLTCFQVTGVAFQTGMIFFSLPTAPAMYVLCGQLNSDTRLASAAIMFSTLCSFFSLSLSLLL